MRLPGRNHFSQVFRQIRVTLEDVLKVVFLKAQKLRIRDAAVPTSRRTTGAPLP
jgi:hypothetical protein